MAKYQRYEEYKDSGVEWLDVIPSHWVMSKIKYIAPFQVGWTPPTGNDSNFIGENIWANISDLRGKIITDTVKRISDKAAKEASMDITPKGSLLYSFKLSVGSVSFAGRDMYTNEAIASFTSDSLLPLEYLYYVLPKFLIENASTNIYGARILNQELIRNAIILKPTYEEAKTIANFLDYQTAQIDTLIDKQQALIQLLKEKRQAVISHAVTKGLNPDAPMKNSGVEWLGEVPEHWNVAGFKKYLNSIIDYRGKTPEKVDSGKFLVTARNIKKGEINYEASQEYVSEKDYPQVMSRGIPEIGDVLFTTEAPLGEVAQVDKTDIALAQRIIKFSGQNGILDNTYLKFYIMSNAFQDSLMTFATGSTALGIKSDRLSYLRQLIPPLKEQLLITEHIERNLKTFDVLMMKAEQAIQLMQERRTALISAAVTGKIDVRGWEAPEVAVF